MDSKGKIMSVLSDLSSGKIDEEEAYKRLKIAPYTDLGFAKVDHHRGLRQGAAEVIYGAGKSREEIRAIVNAMSSNGTENILITRIDPDKADFLKRSGIDITYDERSRIAYTGKLPVPDGNGTIVVVTGGTSDVPVAEEAALTAEVLANKVIRLYDVGVAGIHRLLDKADVISEANVIIAIAGMEGALASVVGGLADCPVIAVPTSVGYGASFNGLSALLSMLNSCASGVSVVNIDNGFGAGYQASMINHSGRKE